MSTSANLKKNLGALREEWKELDPMFKFLDLSVIILTAIFGVGYILLNVLDIVLTMSDAAMLAFPILLAGFVFVLRTQLADEEKDYKKSKKEFYFFTGLMLFIIAMSFVYGLFLSTIE